jgi:hypothetical protein
MKGNSRFYVLPSGLGLRRMLGVIRSGNRLESFDVSQLEAYFFICSRIHEQSL